MTVYEQKLWFDSCAADTAVSLLIFVLICGTNRPGSGSGCSKCVGASISKLCAHWLRARGLLISVRGTKGVRGMNAKCPALSLDEAAVRQVPIERIAQLASAMR